MPKPLLIYRSLLQKEPGQHFVRLCEQLARDPQPSLAEAYSGWFQAVFDEADSWLDWVLTQIAGDDNSFSRRILAQRSVPAALVQGVQQDLGVLQRWVTEVPDQIQAAMPDAILPLESGGRSPLADVLQGDWSHCVTALGDYYRRAGVGPLTAAQAFRWRRDELVGIANPDPISPVELVGYDWQQAALKQNTEALLSGAPALHVLLYGSRGVGKSALVKSLLTLYGDRGLRLIELTRAQLIHLPEVVEQVRYLPQKFIVFVDDLSFEESEEDYNPLKALLEGSLTARPQNLVVYATSNRRHLIREFFGDRPRPSDEIHAWDTVQEKLSLSDRFGLTLTFEPANQDTYLAIVRHLAERAQLAIPVEMLRAQALEWATRQNGRSGRTARQFIDYLIAQSS